MSFFNLEQQCPECSADYRRYAITGKHVNGLHFEEVSYRCGLSIRYIPNFKSTKTEGHCKNSPSYKGLLKKRKKLFNGILQAIEDSNADDEFKEKLQSTLKWYKP